ncbi:MAG: hypothetical protein QOK16_2578, partial [Solirubrobacteraceae bacterium]|nr:hypothetical protein [Solirubrobacteraceae bacterium]
MTITGVSVWRGRDVVCDYLYDVGVKYVFGVAATRGAVGNLYNAFKSHVPIVVLCAEQHSELLRARCRDRSGTAQKQSQSRLTRRPTGVT